MRLLHCIAYVLVKYTYKVPFVYRRVFLYTIVCPKIVFRNWFCIETLLIISLRVLRRFFYSFLIKMVIDLMYFNVCSGFALTLCGLLEFHRRAAEIQRRVWDRQEVRRWIQPLTRRPLTFSRSSSVALWFGQMYVLHIWRCSYLSMPRSHLFHTAAPQSSPFAPALCLNTAAVHSGISLQSTAVSWLKAFRLTVSRN